MIGGDALGSEAGGLTQPLPQKRTRAPFPERVMGRVSRLRQMPGSERTQLIGRHLAGAAVGLQLEGHSLVLLQGTEAGALNGADVHEHVLGAVIRGDEPIALLVVEPLNLACSQNRISLLV